MAEAFLAELFLIEVFLVDKLLSEEEGFTEASAFASGAVLLTVSRSAFLWSAVLLSLPAALSLVTAAASAMILAALFGALFARDESAAAARFDGAAALRALILGSPASWPVFALIVDEDAFNCFDALAGAADLIFDGCRVFLTDLICAPFLVPRWRRNKQSATNRGIRR
ncbi:hypothetical protein [Methylocella silvestris]|uniref:hypothetical protein n=1 Tax=Methylocella silvestris TaxID=199596 RepID=UPI001FCB0922|nr:hypothetical protein [Methylocella silvestris]